MTKDPFEGALEVLEGEDIYRHHVRLRTNEDGMVFETPEIDGRPMPGIRKLAIYTDAEKPAIALIEMDVAVDFVGDAAVIELRPEPPEAA